MAYDIPVWAHAHGVGVFRGRIRENNCDFEVTEKLGIEPAGDGEHDLLWIEKDGANTHWVAGQLARHAGISSRDVGYSGLKDRHALTRQWFSVRRPAGGNDWDEFRADGVRLLEHKQHNRKLRRGTHRRNEFRIAVRGDVGAARAHIEDRLALIKSAGVPNYFGEQRFGRSGNNLSLALAVFAGKRVARNKRSIALSAARAYIFNRILDVRVSIGSWNRIMPGERANLDGSASVFAVGESVAEFESRCAEFDIHPSATLWGDNAPAAGLDVADLENSIVRELADLDSGLRNARLEAGSRALRLVVGDLEWSAEPDVLWLAFSLPKGGYATAVLREIVDLSD